MKFMISYINEILDLITKLIPILSVFLLGYFYWKIRIIDREIERLNKNFEGERNNKRGQGRGIPETIINGQIEELKKVKNETVAPLEREKHRLLTKIPFIK
ncbi:hypothetical protein A3A03_01565 [Candidatus Nomurabacteria bacterium RIFCSPLOWO2_01_FULL_40_18]|uniref:Uncharacterized protein n=1 Tax=Candidatus Nomurabacteria bacterium RIFCSPLOWO2_01_FULL_40_18 TaxID=1801773 RepID=A0A1F6XLE1_9BACT|nr:MAG: hypothetical protein A3A03_01565 [Candidatus Nomurabacteria bacterium RIFCSPLOWO2_01_FULL_40_18]